MNYAQVFVDRVRKSERNWLGVGLVACQGDGTMIASLATSCFSSSPLQTELRAIHFAVKWALHYNFNALYVYSDCFNDALQMEGTQEISFGDKGLVDNIKLDSSNLSCCRILRVSREGVRGAHFLARSALINFVPYPFGRLV